MVRTEYEENERKVKTICEIVRYNQSEVVEENLYTGGTNVQTKC